MTTSRWLYAGAIVAGVLGALRLFLSVQGTVLGFSVSCGNAIGYLDGVDAKHPAGLAICGAALRNASIEGIGLMVVAILLLITAIVKERSSLASARPGWYPLQPGYEGWWDGHRWTMGRPVWEPPRPPPPGGQGTGEGDRSGPEPVSTPGGEMRTGARPR